MKPNEQITLAHAFQKIDDGQISHKGWWLKKMGTC